MFGDIYPTKCMGKTSDMFGRMKFRLPQNIPLQVKTKQRKQDRVIDASLRLHGEFQAEQVDILISKNQALQIIYLKHPVYETS